MFKQIALASLFCVALAGQACAQVQVQVAAPLPGGGYIQAGTGGYAVPYGPAPVVYPYAPAPVVAAPYPYPVVTTVVPVYRPAYYHVPRPVYYGPAPYYTHHHHHYRY